MIQTRFDIVVVRDIVENATRIKFTYITCISKTKKNI